MVAFSTASNPRESSEVRGPQPVGAFGNDRVKKEVRLDTLRCRFARLGETTRAD